MIELPYSTLYAIAVDVDVEEDVTDGVDASGNRRFLMKPNPHSVVDFIEQACKTLGADGKPDVERAVKDFIETKDITGRPVYSWEGIALT